MNLYVPAPPVKTVRLTFRKLGNKLEYLIIEYKPLDEVRDCLSAIINSKVSINPSYRGNKAAIDIREYEGKKAGKSISISIKSEISSKELRQIVLDSIES